MCGIGGDWCDVVGFVGCDWWLLVVLLGFVCVDCGGGLVVCLV